MLFKALAAINRSVVLRQERNLVNLSAVSACDFVHFPVLSYAVLSRNSALFASYRLVLEALFSIKFLLAGGKNEFLTAVFAD